jgi:hypothetical protein
VFGGAGGRSASAVLPRVPRFPPYVPFDVAAPLIRLLDSCLRGFMTREVTSAGEGGKRLHPKRVLVCHVRVGGGGAWGWSFVMHRLFLNRLRTWRRISRRVPFRENKISMCQFRNRAGGLAQAAHWANQPNVRALLLLLLLLLRMQHGLLSSEMLPLPLVALP